MVSQKKINSRCLALRMCPQKVKLWGCLGVIGVLLIWACCPALSRPEETPLPTSYEQSVQQIQATLASPSMQESLHTFPIQWINARPAEPTGYVVSVDKKAKNPTRAKQLLDEIHALLKSQSLKNSLSIKSAAHTFPPQPIGRIEVTPAGYRVASGGCWVDVTPVYFDHSDGSTPPTPFEVEVSEMKCVQR